MPLHHKVEELLSPDELEALRAFISEKNGTRTIDEVHEWVQAKGYTIGRTAVGNWLQKFREQLMVERMQAGGGLARAMLEQGKNAKEMTDAALLGITQKVFEALSSGEEVDADSLNKLALTMQRTTLAGKRAEERAKLAVAEAEKVVEAGGDGRSVVDKVREVLGMK